MVSFLEDLGDAGYRQEMENKKRWERSHAVILQLLKSLSPCLRWVLSFFYYFLVQFASFSFSPHLFCLCCSARSSARSLTWITLTAPFCWKLWPLCLALTWWTSLSITSCPTRRTLARYVGLRAEKHCEGQRVGTFQREQERSCWVCSPAVSAQAGALSVQCTCAVPSAASTLVCVCVFSPELGWGYHGHCSESPHIQRFSVHLPRENVSGFWQTLLSETFVCCPFCLQWKEKAS